MIKIKFKSIANKNIQILCNKSPIIPFIPDFAKPCSEFLAAFYNI